MDPIAAEREIYELKQEADREPFHSTRRFELYDEIAEREADLQEWYGRGGFRP